MDPESNGQKLAATVTQHNTYLLALYKAKQSNSMFSCGVSKCCFIHFGKCSTNRQGQQYPVAHSFSRCAVEFAVCCGLCCLPRKTWNCPFFTTFISNDRLLFNITIYKTIKCSRCKLTFMIIMSINGLV